mmetsp:Transcript_33341/g.70146  ORF Transcript_33341/g.70146 Transcript_33341/m.70146 type:complete len:161 (+) Transcript_33341:33-515(+)|eukprot:CAMPEP_0172303352 /NCGR_PEP_ID=MMETSP1058-20130122/4890_1 /TAXON_ID=83371 /ORGANISM="Detonula confervacea, Strain CCMP 353" /LENGTH=160 /DNA_ID=CAMNT_0013014123 /DNA_START=18 /DNA_END=500 /DNA_ORIENTATION=-
MAEFPLPSNVKEVLSRLAVKDQVVLRSYIAGLRDQLKEHKVKAEHHDDDDDDAHAHFHGHDKCTADHGHGDHGHEDPTVEDSKSCDEKKCTDSGHSHEHEHEHKPEHEHKHEHGHAHGHDHKEEEEIPAWKKRALESGGDANAAPFGGSWGAESSLDASK